MDKPFRFLSYDEFERLGAFDKDQYLRRAVEELKRMADPMQEAAKRDDDD